MTYTLFERYSGKFYDEQAIANVPNEHSMHYLINCFDFEKYIINKLNEEKTNG